MILLNGRVLARRSSCHMLHSKVEQTVKVVLHLLQCVLFQVSTAAVEQYTGEGEPPYCEMTLRATDIAKGDLIILLPVTLIGVRQPNNIFIVERALEAPDGTRYTPDEESDESKS